MSVIADLIRAGVDPELVSRVADELAKARAEGAASVHLEPVRTARQERNRRYYERLKASESKTIKTIKTLSDGGDPFPSSSSPPHPPNNYTPIPSLPSVGPSPGRARTVSKPRTSIASDAQPTEADRLTAERAGMDRPTFRNEWALFRDHHIAEASTMADWSAAWRTWVGKWVRHGSKLVSKSANGARAGPRQQPETTNVFAQYMLDKYRDEQPDDDPLDPVSRDHATIGH